MLRKKCVFALCLIQAVSFYLRGENLISNSGCEVDNNKDNIADGWKIRKGKDFPDNWCMEDTRGAVKLDKEVCHSGIYSHCYVSPKRIEKKEVEEDAWDWKRWNQLQGASSYYAVPLISPEFKVRENERYKLGAWIKVENISSFHVKIIWINTKGEPVWRGQLLSYPGEVQMPTCDWGFWTINVTVPSGMSGCRLDYVIREGETDGKFWTDDVSAELIQ